MGERYEADEITKEEWRAKGDKLRADFHALQAETAAPVDPVELLTLGQQWQKGVPAQRREANQRAVGAHRRRNRKVVKLTPRADRAARAHQLIATALQYVRRPWARCRAELVNKREGRVSSPGETKRRIRGRGSLSTRTRWQPEPAKWTTWLS